jgi:uncharacterized protein (DUF1778 family)
MKTDQTSAEVNIHVRARAHDRALIDQAAELLGSNRSQFMMASALKEAKNVILDQTSIYVDNQTFQKVLDWLDVPATAEEKEGMDRLRAVKAPWSHE